MKAGGSARPHRHLHPHLDRVANAGPLSVRRLSLASRTCAVCALTAAVCFVVACAWWQLRWHSAQDLPQQEQQQQQQQQQGRKLRLKDPLGWLRVGPRLLGGGRGHGGAGAAEGMAVVSLDSGLGEGLLSAAAEGLGLDLEDHVVRVAGASQAVDLRQRRKVMAFVGVYTGFGSAGRRRVLRETWFPATQEQHRQLEEATGLMFRFVIGTSHDKAKEASLAAEQEKYGDFLRLDLEEAYADLNRKTMAYFRKVFQLFDATFYVKADDDIYLRPDRLGLRLMQPRPSKRTYLGCMKKGDVITDKKYKWFEPKGYLLGREYFLHAYGPIYALSHDVVHTITTIRDGTLRMFMNEDVTIGSWMLALDVSHEHTFDLCSAKCTTTSIAVWDLPACSGLCKPVERMPQLHNDPMCSESPTSATPALKT